jgi:hypothetical protein
MIFPYAAGADAIHCGSQQVTPLNLILAYFFNYKLVIFDVFETGKSL